MNKRLLSGMRPTGPLHLGHLVGALDNWVKLQEKFECFYMIADWHALMSEYENPKELERNSIEILADWIACGIDPDKSTIFVQSHIREHLDLNMVLSCLTPLSLLERNPTYKEQLRELKGRNIMTYGFLGYPVLQAADILVYKASVVPVGMDQKAHLELTREIVRKFNNLYGKVFPEPETVLTEIPKLLGFDNRKMSKSFDNAISISDNADTIKKKTMKMITDPKKIHLDDAGHPDICNVCSYYKVFAPGKAKEVEKSCKESKRGCIKCKGELADILIEKLTPIREKRERLLSDKKALIDILKKGEAKARLTASETMKEVRKKVGVVHDL
ncbi:MAG: tryptophan--tRNA ligase [Candidatus Omnitrophica bacterium]|nr:tryptophan--tRNA ligase [Candidatus Omnitrophota bacterium]